MAVFAATTALLALVAPLLATPAPDQVTTDQPKFDVKAASLKGASLAKTSFYNNYFRTCVEGTMRCDAWNRNVFYVCNFNNRVKFNCGPGTVCKQNGNYIYCGWP
ncbi:hypothetical protein H4R35_000392 [Dimargaris xerosporica]|nr:hypothetical protein H4R35_000392 [Dimargaris xerosporica]